MSTPSLSQRVSRLVVDEVVELQFELLQPAAKGEHGLDEFAKE